MKNKLLPLLFVIGSYSAYSQVVIGKKEVTPSAQLEVFASDKGMLIPNVELTSTVDRTTIKNGNVNSLLVFNTKTIADVVPGYYYWYNNRWNKFIISGESNGIATGTGIPGNKGEAGYPGENVSLYTDKATGTVYVQNADGTWASINGKNGLDGRNGIVGGNGVPGAPGTPAVDSTVQMYIDYNTGTVYVRDPKDPNKWITVSGLDGIAGATGVPGTAGSITTLDAIVKDPNGNIYAYVGDNKTVAGRDAEWAAKSPNWVKINGLDGRDGKDGVIGGKGVPGAKGEAGYPGDSVAMYIDNETGTVYVRDPKNPDKWIPLTGKNGIDGIPGVDGAPGTDGAITTLDAIVKDPNGNIYAYVGDDNTVAGRAKAYKDKSTDWVKINGLNGKDGISGATGEKGVDGKITTLDAIIKYGADIYAYVGTADTPEARTIEWNNGSANWVKINGINGIDGKNGINGGNGAPGAPGTPALDPTVEMYIDYTTGTVYVKDPENPGQWVPINGKDGIEGIKGVPGEPGTDGAITTLDAIVKDPNGNIYAYVGDDNTVAGRAKAYKDKSTDWVKINGLNGKDGITGATGEKGVDGKITTLDAIVKYGTDIYAYVGTADTPEGRTAEWNNGSTNWVKINGLNGKNGITGATGEKGVDGKITTLDAIIKYGTDIYAYVGTADTPEGRTAEWNNGSTNWVKINGLNGKNGITGATGEKGVDGKITTLDAIIKYGTDIYAYVGTADTPEARTTEWNNGSTNWVKINGLNGKDGISGATGEKGVDGKITTLDAIIKYGTDIYAYVGTADTPEARTIEWNNGSANWVKINGINGIDGKNGINGGNGAPGAPGTPALDPTVQMYIDYSTGTVYVRDPQDNTKWVPANKETLTSLVFDEASNKLTYTNENSVANVIDLGEAIAAGETKTTLAHNATANTLTYVGEGSTEIINLADITTTTPDTVLEVTGTGATFKAATVNIVPSAVVGDVLTTSETGVVAWKATVKPNVLGIVATSDDYTVKADDYTIIANKLTKDITIKLPNAADNKGRIIVINQHNVVIPNTDTAVQVKFDVNVIYSDTDQYPYIAASLFGGVSKGSAKITLQSDGENWYVITYTM
ncbi:collagen-like protein [Flavobacterium sp. GN10]|uniref:Collagen-like protein n=1 Tax=Flavobacterium tagetis TaxID=2801336 RepID=A0ABS1KGC7_9FLAO|nr:collagen-like protein [Flavobacterium tagetis]MBL0738541.1 collagen-like protein [Flavobacterium tagetis]